MTAAAPQLRWSSSASVAITPVGVVLRSDLGTFQLGGADIGVLVEQIVPMLSAATERDAVVAALPAYSARSVTEFLDLLEARGLVERIEARGPRRGQDVFLSQWSGRDAAQRLAEARIAVVGVTAWTDWAATELRAAGVGALRVDPDLREVDSSWLILAAVESSDPDDLAARARATYRSGAAALWSHMAEGMAVVGPLVVPGQTACRVCAAAAALNPTLPTTAPPRTPRMAVAARMLGSLLAMEASKLVSRYTASDLGGRVQVHDLATYRATMYTVTRLPWCSVCGRSLAARPSPRELSVAAPAATAR